MVTTPANADGATTPAATSSGSSDVMIRAQGLCKFYGNFAAVRDLTFSIPAGQIVAFLGPNGAGKSTTMRLLTGYLSPTSGSAFIAGHDMQTERQAGAAHLGYLPENGPLYPDMTPRSLLEFFGRARGMAPDRLKRRMEAVVEACDLQSVFGKAIGKLSRGFRQRVGMAQVLLNEPDVLILDEPTAGLDPNQTRDMRKTIKSLGKDHTILLSTHILQEVQAMADRVLLVHEGRLVFDGTPAELAASGDAARLESRFAELTGARA